MPAAHGPAPWPRRNDRPRGGVARARSRACAARVQGSSWRAETSVVKARSATPPRGDIAERPRRNGAHVWLAARPLGRRDNAACAAFRSRLWSRRLRDPITYRERFGPALAGAKPGRSARDPCVTPANRPDGPLRRHARAPVRPLASLEDPEAPVPGSTRNCLARSRAGRTRSASLAPSGARARPSRTRWRNPTRQARRRTIGKVGVRHAEVPEAPVR